MVDLGKAEYCILNEFKDCFDNFYSKHSICKYMSADWVNKVKEKFNTRIGALNKTLHKHKHKDSFNSSDTKKVLGRNRFVVVPIDKPTCNISLFCKQFYV